MMRFSIHTFSVWLLISLLFGSPLALAEHHEDDPNVYVQEPCTAEESRLPEETYSTEWADVVYITGGIGYCESQEMRRIAREYPVELMFVRKTPDSEHFLAGIPVIIKDVKGNLVLETVTKGPYLLAKLPPGRYVITGDYYGVVKTHHLTASQKHQRVVFVWRAKYK